MKDLIYSNNVHDLRKDRNISQNKMAEDLGVSRRTISKIENCDQNLSLEMAYRISAYFNLLIPEVFPLTEKDNCPTCIGTNADSPLMVSLLLCHSFHLHIYSTPYRICISFRIRNLPASIFCRALACNNACFLKLCHGFSYSTLRHTDLNCQIFLCYIAVLSYYCNYLLFCLIQITDTVTFLRYFLRCFLRYFPRLLHSSDSRKSH